MIDAETRSRRRIYIAGPMTGLPEWNFPAFDRAEARLKGKGFEVVNPARIARRHDVERVLSDPAEFRQMLQDEWDALDACDAIYLLTGWERSRGTRRELVLAIEGGKEIIQERR